MNKKVFTLLAASLMLFTAVFGANAQKAFGDTVEYLPSGVGVGAYHLQLTKVGHTDMTRPLFVAMDDYGYLTVVDSAYIFNNSGDSAYTRLRSALWCVNTKVENLGKVPAYTFMNKEYGADLAASWSESDATFTKREGDKYEPDFTIGGKIVDIKAQADIPLVEGQWDTWKFSRTYTNQKLETNQYIAIEVKTDYYLTLAKVDSFEYTGNPGGSPLVSTTYMADSCQLHWVVAHKNEFVPGMDFYENHLAFFTLTTAAPRVLNAAEFNTMLYEKKSADYRTLKFSQDVSAGQTNPFAQPLMAEDVNPVGVMTPVNHYLYLHNSGNQYVTLLDGSDANNYYNAYGIHYPKLSTTGTKPTSKGEGKFRLVYYPSEDSLVINAQKNDHIDYGAQEDTDPYVYDGLYSQKIWDFLIVRMQDLGTDNVITVANRPANVRISFGIHDCQGFETNRTTVPTDLYTIQDSEGRYLVVPLYAGSLTPQWMYLDENEVAEKTPADQWMVVKTNENSSTSRIHLVNREFNDMWLEYVQIYTVPTKFIATAKRVQDANNQTVIDLEPVNQGNLVSVEGFKRVTGDARHDPFLGYKSFSDKKLWNKDEKDVQLKALEDSLNWYGYKFNYLSGLSDAYYMGTNASKDPDTTIFVLKEDPTFFQLVLPDTLRQKAYGFEKFGIGHVDTLLNRFSDSSKENYIAPLKRAYYYMMINDYWKFTKNDNYLVMDDNGRYGYTKETQANKRELNKAKFYLRFTYQPENGPEYYTLLDRIDIANFHYMADVMGLTVIDTLRAYDKSHGSQQVSASAFGIVMASVDDKNLYVRAQVKTTGANRVSTFSLSTDTDPLYRRFNTVAEGSVATDGPDTVKFFRTNNPSEYLYEDAHSTYSYTIKPVNNHGGVNFLGVENEHDCKVLGEKEPVHLQHQASDWAIYVDTAYVNRGTGWIKPQYMLVQGPEWVKLACISCGENVAIPGEYLYGRFLRNETDSARKDPSTASGVRDKDYLKDGKWERLAFTPAIHWGDTLYVLNGRENAVKNPDGSFNFKKLRTDAVIKRVPLGNNLHKDEVFSFRFTEVGGGADKDFMIESETTNRNAYNARMIAPMQGGWIKIQNGVPVISRGSYADAINEAEVWNVKKTDKAPVANDEVSATDVTVVAGAGQVTILNASGKQVVVSNILGQTIANVVLTSDNQTIAAPQGVVVVAIEGESTVKAVVK